MKTRDYQTEAVQSLYRFFGEHTDPARNPVIAMPTGTGKSIVIGDFVRGVIQTWPSQRVMMLTHVKELIEQNSDKLRQMWPNAPLGIFSAGLGSKDATAPITFAGIQSAAKDPSLFRHQDLVLVDECHLVSPKDNTSYKTFLAALRKVNPSLRVIGLSATAYRLGLGMITEGGVFTDIAYDITGLHAFNRLIDEGYLSPLVPMPVGVEVDTSNLHLRGGEFVTEEMRKVFNDEITWRAIQDAVLRAADRAHWLVFAVDIPHAKMIVQMLTALGVSAAAVHSNSKEHPLSAFERDDNIARFKAGQLQALVNVDILTTGFDFPALDCIILLRSTNSPGLHVQILGRGTRPFFVPGFDLDTIDGRLASIAAGPKRNCLVLDYAGNTRRLGPINDPRIPGRKGKGKGDMPLKTCDACGCLNHISARFCLNCGAEFIFQEKITDKASTIALIVRDEPQVETFKVDRVTYAPHKKPGPFPATLKVSYFCGVQRFTEWVCLEHHGNPILRKAHEWWHQRDFTRTQWNWADADATEPDLRDTPKTVNDALTVVDKLAIPSSIRVWVNKPRYPEILSYIFEKEPQNV